MIGLSENPNQLLQDAGAAGGDNGRTHHDKEVSMKGQQIWMS